MPIPTPRRNPSARPATAGSKRLRLWSGHPSWCRGGRERSRGRRRRAGPQPPSRAAQWRLRPVPPVGRAPPTPDRKDRCRDRPWRRPAPGRRPGPRRRFALRPGSTGSSRTRFPARRRSHFAARPAPRENASPGLATQYSATGWQPISVPARRRAYSSKLHRLCCPLRTGHCLALRGRQRFEEIARRVRQRRLGRWPSPSASHRGQPI